MIYKFSLIERILLSNDIIPHPFADASSSVGLGFALGSAIKLKIADQLTTDFKDIKQIAKDANVSEIGAELILDSLDVLGYVKKMATSMPFQKGVLKIYRHNLRIISGILFCFATSYTKAI